MRFSSGLLWKGCTGVKKRPTVGRKKNLLWVLFLGYPKALSGRAGKRGRRQGCIPLKLQRLLGRRERVGDFSFQGGGEIASSFPWESGFRTAVEIAERRGNWGKVCGGVGGLRNYYLLSC